MMAPTTPSGRRCASTVAAFLDHPHRQLERAEIAEEGGHAQHLAGGVRQWLALFAGEQARQLARIGFDHVSDLDHKFAALLDRGRGPGRVGGLRGGDRLVELVLRGARAFRQHFLGRGIEDRHGKVAGHLPSIRRL
jgi:hypothetical protein